MPKRIARPKVAAISTNTPIFVIHAIHRTPTTLTMVWIARMPKVNPRIVFGLAGLKCVCKYLLTKGVPYK